MVSRKLKFSAATVVDSFIRFRARAVLRGVSTLTAPRIGSSLEDMPSAPFPFYPLIYRL
jgi:hypothetical protein